MNHTINPSGDKGGAVPAWFALPRLVFGQLVATEYEYPTLREIAKHVALLLGAQTFPTDGKGPLYGHKWGSDKELAAPGVQDTAPGAWEQATGYAIAALPGSDLYTIDVDKFSFLARLTEKFPRLLLETPLTYSGDLNLAMDGHCHLFVRLSLGQPLAKTLSISNSANKEIASLRGHGSYVIGPGSLHPSGQRYRSNSISTPFKLNEEETVQLLGLFSGAADQSQPYKPKFKAIYLRQRRIDYKTLKEAITAELKQRGYRPNGEWLNGPCLSPKKHHHGDAHASFGFNTRTGYGHCFAPGCNLTLSKDIAHALGIDVPRAQPSPESIVDERRFAFDGALPNHEHENDPERIRVELNIAAALFRRGCYQSARFYDLLCHESGTHNGQATYATKELLKLGARYKLSRDQVFKALRQMISLSLLEKLGKARYRRVGLSKVQEALGLGKEFAPVYLSREAYTGSPSRYFGVVLLAIEHYLPGDLASATIAMAAGVSRHTVYNHENALGVFRKASTLRVSLATATDPSFIKVFDAKGDFVFCVPGPDKQLAQDLVEQFGGKARGWQRLPSARVLPNL